MTPLYDLMATILHPEVSTKLAMQIAKTSALEDLDGRTGVRFAGAVGLAIPYTMRSIAALTATIESKLGEVMDGF